jgi:replicative DNA helicase
MGTPQRVDIIAPIYAERAVLATLLQKPGLWAAIARDLTPEMFGTPGGIEKVSAAIWQALRAKEDVNPATIAARCPEFDVYGLLSDYDEKGLEENAETIRTEFIRRSEIAILTSAAARMADMGEDVKEVQSWIASERAKFYKERDRQAGKEKHLAAITEWLTACVQSGGFSGVHTGYNDLNVLTGGYQRGDLIVLAARPSMGKTTMAVVQAVRAAKAGCPALFITIEVDPQSIYLKANAFFSGVEIPKLRRGDITPADLTQFDKAHTALESLPFFVEDGGGMTLDQISATVWEYKRKHGIEIVYIDYLQLMTANKERGKSREQEVSEISRGLKLLAKSARLPIKVLAQLSRAVETRGGSKRPMLSDLRESGAVEQDADIVEFIYRPEYYGINEDTNGVSVRGVTEFIVAKHRNGPIATLYRRFGYPFSDFTEAGSDYEPVKTDYNPTIVRPSGDDDEIPF